MTQFLWYAYLPQIVWIPAHSRPQITCLSGVSWLLLISSCTPWGSPPNPRVPLPYQMTQLYSKLTCHREWLESEFQSIVDHKAHARLEFLGFFWPSLKVSGVLTASHLLDLPNINCKKTTTKWRPLECFPIRIKFFYPAKCSLKCGWYLGFMQIERGVNAIVKFYPDNGKYSGSFIA